MAEGDGGLVGKRLGVVGGGQLGRMLAEAAAPLGVELVVLDPSPAPPAAPVADQHIVGAFDDREAVRTLAADCDLLTFEIELADPDLLAWVQAESGIEVHPAPDTLEFIQDKWTQKTALRDAGIAVPACERVDSIADLRDAGDRFGYPMMLKARRGGYDGRGNVPVTDPDAVPDALSSIGTDAMVEEHVDFARELSVIGVKGTDEWRTYVPGENVHHDEILRETIVPARADDHVLERAIGVAESVLEFVTGRGVYGIELFETQTGEILVNEIAPRPHNSGHWTIEGAVTSQFEQHVRAVFGAPLGASELRSPIVTANILGDVDAPQPSRPRGITAILATEHTKLHWYGKQEVRPLRKMGHLSVYGSDEPGVRRLVETAREHVDLVTFRG